jgi:predicted ribosomally synthesized peptide with nif11-like leader
MSVQKAKDFLVHIATDQAASEKARAAHEAALMQVASGLGFSFSASDLREAMDDMGQGELSGAELHGIAGGRARRVVDS